MSLLTIRYLNLPTTSGEDFFRYMRLAVNHLSLKANTLSDILSDITHSFVIYLQRTDNPTLSIELTLSTAFNAANNTARPSETVTTLLFYHIMIKIPVNASKLLDRASEMKAMASAGKKTRMPLARDRDD